MPFDKLRLLWLLQGSAYIVKQWGRREQAANPWPHPSIGPHSGPYSHESIPDVSTDQFFLASRKWKEHENSDSVCIPDFVTFFVCSFERLHCRLLGWTAKVMKQIREISSKKKK